MYPTHNHIKAFKYLKDRTKVALMQEGSRERPLDLSKLSFKQQMEFFKLD
jgi:hypothetical protein